MTPVLQMSGVAVAFDGRPILRDVDMEVAGGEVVAVLGANGSGKSTLVRAALGLLPVAAGKVTLFGDPVPHFRDWARIGYVPQHGPAPQGVPASVREVVSTGRLARRRPLLPSRAADRAAVAAALEVVSLTERAEHPFATLSGGQRQRVLIGRALAAEPELLVLDEPNAGVDLVNQDAIAGALRELSRRGTTIVVVLHELGVLTDLINRTVVLREGRMVQDAPRIVSLDAHCEPDANDLDVTARLAAPWDEVR